MEYQIKCNFCGVTVISKLKPDSFIREYDDEVEPYRVGVEHPKDKWLAWKCPICEQDNRLMQL